MGVFKRQDNPHQGFLLPPSLKDWLPEDHLVWFIADTVEALELDAFVERYRACGKGEQAYPPRMMLKVLLFAYSTGVFSSRKIAAKLETDVAFRVLGAGLFPDFRTICRFRTLRRAILMLRSPTMHRLFLLVAGLAGAAPAAAQMRITEWQYNGDEFIEFTNVGTTPIDMTGWSFDDDSRLPETVDLSAFAVVAPGASVILSESSAAAFAANWTLSGVAVIGGNTTNLGRNDEINLYDASNNLVDRLTYGDQNFPPLLNEV